MADIEEKGDRGMRASSEGVSLHTPDAQAARVAGASEVKAFQSLNKNAHSGSAGSDQNESIQIVATDFDGRKRVIAARQPEPLESISMEELVLKGRKGDEFAIIMVQQMRTAAGLPEEQRIKIQAKLQDTADRMYGRGTGEGSLSEQSKLLEYIDTQTMKALAPSNEVARSALEMRESIEKHVPAGLERDKLIALLKADVTPVLKAHVERNVNTQHVQNEWQAFNRLTPKQQRTVIEAFQTGSNIGQEAYERQIQSVAESVPKGFYNVGKGLYDSGIQAGAFLVEAAQRPEKVSEAAQKLSESLSTAVISGVKISKVLASYGHETAQSGDYSRPLRDLQTVTAFVNERWEATPLEMRTEKASELIADLGIGSVIGAADRLAKSGKVIDALEDLAKYARDLTAPGREKARQALGSFLDAVFQPKAISPDGLTIAVPQKSRDNYLMSKADDLGDQQQKLPESSRVRGSIHEQLLPSQRFVAELQQAVEGLSAGERNFLREHNIVIKPVRRITDQFPDINTQTAGCFDASEKTIYLAEEVFSKGKWVPNNDLPFMARHEFGHAYNAKIDAFGDYVSNFKQFRESFQHDLQNIPPDVLDALQLSRTFRTPELARDEVFADIYAHTQGLQSNNPYSQLIKQWFLKSLKFMEDMPKW
ncbi:hypothetical protein KBI23_27085 [bacterium]|nr:hypothetical protein [bacterium]